MSFTQQVAPRSFSAAVQWWYPSRTDILWMDEILHQLRKAGCVIPLQISTHSGFKFQSGAGLRLSTWLWVKMMYPKWVALPNALKPAVPCFFPPPFFVFVILTHAQIYIKYTLLPWTPLQKGSF